MQGSSENIDKHDINSLPRGWAARRSAVHRKEKIDISKYFIDHEFLVLPGNNASNARDTVASILVNQGTTPDAVAAEGLNWMQRNWFSGPYDITWYTTSGLINATLRDFREENEEMQIGAQIFLFPGRVDTDMQAVSGPEAVRFVKEMNNNFTYSFLSVYNFDLDSGNALFHYEEEIELQRECANLYAEHKFLFLDSGKFRRVGKPSYGLELLLRSAQIVTIYTNSSTKERDRFICEKWESLALKILRTKEDFVESTPPESAYRTLRLRLVEPGGADARTLQRDGYLTG